MSLNQLSNLLPLADVASPLPLLFGALVFVAIVVAILVAAGVIILLLVTRHRKRSQKQNKTEVNQ